MPKKGKRRKGRQYTKGITLFIRDKSPRRFFLQLLDKLIKYQDVTLDVKMERIDLTFTGPRDDVESLLDRIIKLQTHIDLATRLDRNNLYYYESAFLYSLFPVHLPMIFLNRLLSLSGFNSSVDENNNLTSDIEIAPLMDIYQLSVNTIATAPSGQNKDIRHFSSIFGIVTKQDQEQLLNYGSENGVLHKTNGTYQFALDVQDAYEKMSSLVMNVKLKPIINVDKDHDPEDYLNHFKFDGGKIIFTRDGEELEQSPFDTPSETDE
ncbi:MAG: DUF2067 family protein [Candidatus Heimdallarchaeota archaeon]|nr:DUF2067 family protein [Candidatus Heimdallarchaeota archaeon]